MHANYNLVIVTNMCIYIYIYIVICNLLLYYIYIYYTHIIATINYHYMIIEKNKQSSARGGLRSNDDRVGQDDARHHLGIAIIEEYNKKN